MTDEVARRASFTHRRACIKGPLREGAPGRRGFPTKEGGGECGTWDWGRYIFVSESQVILAFS